MADFATSGERHKPQRRNKDTVAAVELAKDGAVEAATEAAPDMPWLEPNPEWGDEVTNIFNSIKHDVMGRFMTPSSWALLYLKCSAWDKEFKPKFLGVAADGTVKYGEAPLPAGVLADIQKTMESIGATEKSRREMKILIDPTPDSGVSGSVGDAKMSAKKSIARPARRALGGGRSDRNG